MPALFVDFFFFPLELVGELHVFRLRRKNLLDFSLWMSLINYLFCFQEILFYKDGEPKIDGEPGDLKVAIFLYILR